MKRTIVLGLLLICLLFSACGSDRAVITSFDDMKDQTMTIGLPDDVDVKALILEKCPKAEIVAQNDVLYGVRSVSEGKLDAIVMGRNHIEEAINETGTTNVKILEEPLYTFQCAMGLSALCEIPDFENSVNEVINHLISEGIIDEMWDRWFNQGQEKMPEIAMSENPTYTVKAVTFGQAKPYSYMSSDGLVGFDMELLYRVCAETGWGITLTNADYPGMLMGLTTGKYDIVSANLYVTEDREENVDFSIPYRTDEIALAVRDDSLATGEKILEYGTLDELKSAKKFGVTIGTVCDDVVKEYYPQAEIEYYPGVVECSLAMVSGKVDAVIYDMPALEYIEASSTGVAVIDEYIVKDDYHFILPKSSKGESLQKEFNAWLSEEKQSGNVQKMEDFWCGNEEPTESLNFEDLPATNGTLKLAASVGTRPDIYYSKDNIAGFSAELVYNFCRDKGYGAEISIISFGGMIPYLVSEKADMIIGFISYSEERAENVLYTDCILESGMGVLVRASEEEGESSFYEVLVNGLKKTFVTESRWKLIISGLWVTLIITLGSFLLANILGVIFCACAMSKRKGLRVLADVYDRIMQGTPIVVILMILYYVIFGRSDISGIWVAIIGFGLASGASLTQQFFGAVKGVDIGQTEAALAIGFTKFEAFIGIVLPQATRIALPGYFSEIIGLMKGTAIVGYIAVTDLTKASDLIRSSTYDAFFPLLSVALIYFLIAFIILSLLKYFQRKLAPKRVNTQEVNK